MAATLDLVKRRLADAPRSGDTRSPHSAARRRSTPMRRRAWRIASLAACIALWQAAVHWRLSRGSVTFADVPAPSDVDHSTRLDFG